MAAVKEDGHSSACWPGYCSVWLLLVNEEGMETTLRKLAQYETWKE